MRIDHVQMTTRRGQPRAQEKTSVVVVREDKQVVISVHPWIFAKSVEDSFDLAPLFRLAWLTSFRHPPLGYP